VHGLPLPTSAELRRRCSSNSVENGVELGIDLGLAFIQELRGGSAAALILVVLDLPATE
jgi:hypothetical protein